MGEPGRMRQKLIILQTNSTQFILKGFVRLAITVIKDTRKHIELSFTVEDSGIGIEEEV